MDDRNAFADGAWAHDDGQSLDRNPYDPGTKGHVDWRDGWTDAQGHAAMNGNDDDE